MVELYLMASHGYPPGLRVLFHPEQSFSRVSKDFQHLAPFLHMPNQATVNLPSVNLSLQQKEQLKTLFDCHHFVRIDASSKRPALIDSQDAHAESVLFSFSIAAHFARQEKVLKLLASGEIEVEGDSLDLSMLNELMGPQPLMTELPSLLYPTREFYLNEPFLDTLYQPDEQLQCNSFGTGIGGMLYDVADLYLSKNTNKSSKQTMIVPYFERRRRTRANTDVTKVAVDRVGSLEKNEKLKNKQPQKKTNTRSSKERDIYSTSYVRACESLLSVIVNRKHQDENIIASLKKSGPKLPQLLSQFSASIAGTGIAVVLSVVCRVACTRVPFCASKLLSTGLGLGLVWLSWAVNRLRDTVSSMSKTSGKFKAKEEEMMNRLDSNLKDIYFRAMALTAVAVLSLV